MTDTEAANPIETLRDRIERLRGLVKTASGWLLDADDIEHADDLLRLVGDMEPITDSSQPTCFSAADMADAQAKAFRNGQQSCESA